jgi:hypothetical protein
MPDTPKSALSPLTMIEDAVPFSPERDRECFEEVRAVLVRHGALHRFGMCLLHDHFRIDTDEVLVETVDVASRTLTIRPAKRSQLDQMSIETHWRLDGSEAEPKIRCVQKCIPAGNDKHGRAHFSSVH